ncbi:TPA: hypothetical protein R5723_000185 [Campylobacter jejuni]|nr:hypothetical protein [Campylobacter jejuni]ECP8671837.1 hypothetical protein [Campylobacter jejuni]EDP2965541.1 hypothetical protein [Campylobacter jejuni]HEC2492130.1 hypothetical protein [Campylobacter jejuni]HED7179818.1 hypothetical protein [Campylobacter jejuni]
MAVFKDSTYFKTGVLMAESKIDLADLDSKEGKGDTLFTLPKGYVLDSINIEVTESSDEGVKVAIGTIEDNEKFCLVVTNTCGNTQNDVMTEIKKNTNITAYIKEGQATEGQIVVRAKLIAPTLIRLEF